ncbi:hypothetical protein BH24ACT23_BH24ACT23_06560 [soil metagenome]
MSPKRRGKKKSTSERPADRTAKREVVLYRCPTPTNYLCPCGSAARTLKKAGVEYRTERVPYRRSSRPEIEELTSQQRVPVLVDRDEIVSDSRRIAEYVEWKSSRPGKSARPE